MAEYSFREVEREVDKEARMKAARKFFDRSSREIALFAYVTALAMFPNFTVSQRIRRYYNDFGISEADYPIDTAISTYNRMLKNYNDMRKTEKERIPQGDFAAIYKVEYVALKNNYINTTLPPEQQCNLMLYYVDGIGYEADELTNLQHEPGKDV